jgi:hypothetical protein
MISKEDKSGFFALTPNTLLKTWHLIYIKTSKIILITQIIFQIKLT